MIRKMILCVLSVGLWSGCVTNGAAESTASAAVLSPSITTDASSYVLNQPITVSWSGLPGNALDWIGYAPAGSPDNVVTRWARTGGAASGSRTLEGTTAEGSYVARAFVDDSYGKLAESRQYTVSSSVGPEPTTLIVPVTTPSSEAPRSQIFAVIDGCECLPSSDPHVVYAPLAIPVGTVIHDIRAHLKDGGDGTLAQISLVKATDGGQVLTSLLASAVTTGSSIEENACVICGGTPVVTAPRTLYYVKIANVAGTNRTVAYRIEADVN